MTAGTDLTEQFDRAYSGSDRPRHIGIAVSGGSDSLALLHLLKDWGGAKLSVVTVDHGLREEAAGEARYVAQVAASLGLKHTTLRWRAWDGRGNLQDQARRTRYSMLADWAKAHGVDAVALGHTQDDQAETFLMRLSREAGISGLSAMARRFERNGMRFDRPLLGMARADLRDLLARRGVTWIEDPSNDDDAYDRVKARKALGLLAPLGITAERLAAVAGHMESARRSLALRSLELAGRMVRIVAGDVVIDRSALRALPDEDFHRLMAVSLRFVSSEEYAPRARAIFALSAPIAARENAALHGCRLLVSDMTVRITRELNAVATHRTGTRDIWDHRWRLTGPHQADLEIRPLGEALSGCADWRETGIPRASLMASPSVWQGTELLAAPLAGLPAGWTASAPGRDEFADLLISH